VPTRPWLFPALLSLAMLGTATAAHADVITDEEAACRDKKEGDACSAQGKAGACATKKCGRLDYSKGTPPTSKDVDCLWCVADAKAEATPEPTPAKTDAKPTDAKPTDAKPTDATPTDATPTDEKATDAKATADTKPVAAKIEAKVSDSKSSGGGCGSRIGGTPTSLVSLLVGAGLLAASRRRARSRR